MNKKTAMPDQEFWKRKLMALLHDPPCKPLDFSPKHEEIAWQFCKSEGIGDDEKEVFNAIKDADWMASASDRMSFKPRECSNKFTGQSGETFKHPLSGDEYVFKELPESSNAEGILQDAIGGVKSVSDETKWKDTFFLYWRRWLEESVKADSKFGSHFPYYPAETRLPDHSIWHHISLTSALQGCRDDAGKINPSFLSFNLGPVQEFIAQARSTRDLWSGSYMLAWLTAHAMKAVADYNGPDSIIFPSLRGQGIFDVLYRDELYSKISYGGDSLWKRMYNDGDKKDKIASAKRLLNPTLPNRFLAVVPSEKAEEIAHAAEKAVIRELRGISESCWSVFTEAAGEKAEEWKKRWDRQIELFPRISWSITPWEENVDAALAKFAKLPTNKLWKESGGDGLSPSENFKRFLELARKSGYHSDGSTLNIGSVWAAHYALAEFAMAARRNCREFDQYDTDDSQHGTLKDALSGKEEIIGDEDYWNYQKTTTDEQIEKDPGKLFRQNEGPYGAMNIVKRLWVKGHLLEQLKINKNIFHDAMTLDSVPDVAGWNILTSKERDKNVKPGNSANPYVAIIAMDGDEMGKWISGVKNPALYEQICENAKEFIGEDALKDIRRPISPAFHLQFSEALANFANHLSGKIVERYDGQLIYAGGDDVLAMLPASTAINCARALRAVFRGAKEDFPDDLNSYELNIDQNGFVNAGVGYSLMVPGPKADVSCGIAIAHKNHPLQHIVEEARSAERRAKNDYARGAFAVSLLKRGGETVHWGAKWDWNAIDLYDQYRDLRDREIISARFPYALAGLLHPYALEDEKDDSMRLVVEKELAHVMEQQGGKPLKKYETERKGNQMETFCEACEKYLNQLFKFEVDEKEGKTKLADFAKLFLTAAFIERDRGGE